MTPSVNRPAHNKRRCVTCCKPPNPNTACGHDHCAADDCSALDVYAARRLCGCPWEQPSADCPCAQATWRTDYTSPGFTHPEENDA